MKTIIIKCLLLCLSYFHFNSILSQSLNVGDTFPNTIFREVLNYKDTNLSIKDFRDKVVVFDFWGFNCTSCLESFKKLEELQAKFGDRIQIILVNYNSISENINFFEKRKSKLPIPRNIPLITTDTLLRKYFPHGSSPYLVYINEKGIVSSINAGISLEILNNFLNKGLAPIGIPEKGVFIKSLFEKSFEPNISFAIYIAKAFDSLRLYITDERDPASHVPHSIMELYQIAYNESYIDDPGFGFNNYGRTVLDVRDESKYRIMPGTNYQVWRGENSYYYHSILPSHMERDRYRIMKQNLDAFFNLNTTIEKRKVKVLELIRTSKANKMKTVGGERKITSLSETPLKLPDADSVFFPSLRALKNIPYQEFSNAIKGICTYKFKVMFQDATKLSGNIDFEIPESEINHLTIESFRKYLKRYDLDLVEKQELMDVIVISEK